MMTLLRWHTTQHNEAQQKVVLASAHLLVDFVQRPDLGVVLTPPHNRQERRPRVEELPHVRQLVLHQQPRKAREDASDG